MTKIRNEIKDRIDLTKKEEEDLKLNIVDQMFDELKAIENEISKYNMEWVFSYSHDRIEEVFEAEIKGAFCSLREDKEGETIVKETNNMIHKIAKTIEKNARAFNGAKTLSTVGEIVGSFIFIMTIHELTTFFVTQYSNLISASIIVTFFAFFKIFIEQRYVSKFNRKREERVYKLSLQKTRKAFIQMFMFYLKVRRFDETHKNISGKERHKKALIFIKENHPKLEFN
ncbi:MAG: hypothetical protein PQJ49_07585 [Sphaerochaetaceae bacterium]|nr:hypothetical protein [Sphaerochaetaceae bacterium]MDC7249759.1 hypothetical protein [Sphaerochaetaceae bacterium]